MPSTAIDIEEFTANIKELIAGLKRGEEIVITSDNLPVAKLTAVNGQTEEQPVKSPKHRQAGLTKGSAWMSSDFNAPLQDFAEYMP